MMRADQTQTDFCSDAKLPGSAYGMTVALMIFDYVDRQVIVSMFPFLKAEWNLSDKELGLLVSIISITVALFGIPVAWIADRFSRVKSIVAMAALCEHRLHFLHVRAELRSVAARARHGWFGAKPDMSSVGAAMVATHFPQRMRSGLLGGFFASASVGSVLGVVLGGVIATRFWLASSIRCRRHSRPVSRTDVSPRA